MPTGQALPSQARNNRFSVVERHLLYTGRPVHRSGSKIYVAVGQSVKACGGLGYNPEVVKLQPPVRQESHRLLTVGVSMLVMHITLLL